MFKNILSVTGLYNGGSPQVIDDTNPMPVKDGNLGNQADAAADSDTDTSSLIALFKRLLQKHTAGINMMVGSAPVSGANPVPISGTVQSETLTKGAVTASASGDTMVVTPSNGKKLRLYFFGYSASAAVSGCLVGLKLEGYNGGAVFDQQYLSAPGQPYARNIQGGKRYIEGATGNDGGTAGRLIVNLSAAQAVYVNYEVEEV